MPVHNLFQGPTTTSTSSTSTSSTSSSISSTSSSISSTSSSISSTSVSVSTTSASTSTSTLPPAQGIKLFCGTDMVWSNSTPRDYKEFFYAYAPITISMPDSQGDVTIYFSVPGKALDYTGVTTPYYRRVKSVERNYGVISGYQNDFAHFTGGQENAWVCPAGSVVTYISINIAP